MRSEHSRILWSSAFSLLLAVMGGVAQAGPKPLPTNSNAYGAGYAESTAGWLEWLLSIPNATSPLFDTDGSDAAVGQSGKVWFLVGNGSGGDTERTVTVPAGKALFFPIVNFFWVNLPEWGDNPWSPTQEAWVRDYLADTVDTAQDLVLEIDGQPIANVSRLRVSGAVGACTLPVAAADNIFGVDLSPGAHECVADGYWALLPPMSAGRHEIHFAGGFASSGFSLNVTYDITVVGGKK